MHDNARFEFACVYLDGFLNKECKDKYQLRCYRQSIALMISVIFLFIIGWCTFRATKNYIDTNHWSTPSTYTAPIVPINGVYIGQEEYLQKRKIYIIESEYQYVYTQNEQGEITKILLSGKTIDYIFWRNTTVIIKEDSDNPRVEFYNLGWFPKGRRQAIVYLPINEELSNNTTIVANFDNAK
jgi:hypothetical protein